MTKRKSYIIIHGTGGTLKKTIEMLAELNSVKANWFNGVFYTNKKIGLLLRKILSDTDDNSKLFSAARKIIVSRLLMSCENPALPEKSENFATFDEANIIDRFADLDIPYGPAARKKASERLKKQGESEFLNAFGKKQEQNKINFASFMNEILHALRDEKNGYITESEAFVKIIEIAGNDNSAKDLVQLREMGESGADLDTISSATFYAHALKHMAYEQGDNFTYGQDYEFIFVNYHQGLLPIIEEFPEPGNIYMADIPIGTIPDLRSDLTILSQKGYKLVRYEDHHPYSTEQLEMLHSLHTEGMLDYFAMTGPLQGEEVPVEALKCGGDMVYEALVMGQKWDSPAMAYLRKCVHGEDLAQERSEEGKMLTELIKGGTNSIEIVQTLLSCEKEIDIKLKLSEKGWDAKIAKERSDVALLETKFKEALQVIEIERPLQDKGLSGQAVGWGSDMPAPLKKEMKDSIKILIAMAPSSSRKEPKLKIGKAQEYFAREMPDSDYLLYCYGSSLIVGRRLNQADISLNLSVLMRKIGTESDGGHAGAAVCGPEKNPNYPKSILGRVNKGNFKLYCKYLEKHIAEDLNVKVISRKDISSSKPTKSQENGVTQLLILIAVTIIFGSAVIILNPEYRPSKLAKLNSKDFFVWFGKTPPPKESEDADNSTVEENNNERLNAQ